MDFDTSVKTVSLLVREEGAFAVSCPLYFFVFQDKELYLLDDPLSAVDQQVASHLFHRCITGVLKHKTRILCTHHTRYLACCQTTRSAALQQASQHRGMQTGGGRGDGRVHPG